MDKVVYQQESIKCATHLNTIVSVPREYALFHGVMSVPKQICYLPVALMFSPSCGATSSWFLVESQFSSEQQVLKGALSEDEIAAATVY